MDPSGIEGIESDNAANGSINAVYNVGGMKTTENAKGINIIKYSDGRKRKVIK